MNIFCLAEIDIFPAEGIETHPCYATATEQQVGAFAFEWKTSRGNGNKIIRHSVFFFRQNYDFFLFLFRRSLSICDNVSNAQRETRSNSEEEQASNIRYLLECCVISRCVARAVPRCKCTPDNAVMRKNCKRRRDGERESEKKIPSSKEITENRNFENKNV